MLAIINTYVEDSSQVVDLYTYIKNIVVDLKGFPGNFKISSKIDKNLIEQEIEINSIIIEPYELDGCHITKAIYARVEHIQYEDSDEYLATFEEAGISFSGKTKAQAIQELKIEIVEVYKIYKSEKHLGSWPKRQLAILENYIDKKKL